MKINKK